MGEEGGLPEDVVCPAVGIRGQGKPEFREVEDTDLVAGLGEPWCLC
jgi:hypothetical protein